MLNIIYLLCAIIAYEPKQNFGNIQVYKLQYHYIVSEKTNEINSDKILCNLVKIHIIAFSYTNFKMS